MAACGAATPAEDAPTAGVTSGQFRSPSAQAPGGTSPTRTGPPAPFDALLDEPAPAVLPPGLVERFSDPASLSTWRVSYGEAISGQPARVSIQDGALQVVAAHSQWLDNSHAAGVARAVDGDVTIIAEIDVRGVASPEPTVNWSLAGIMLRAPGMQGDESWIHWSTGYVLGPVLERKSTRGGASVLSLIPVDPGPVTLQLIRAGDEVLLLHRQGDQPWLRDVTYGRADLPAQVEVLLTAQSGGESDHADMVAVYDNVRITPGAPPPEVIDAVRAGDTSGLPR